MLGILKRARADTKTLITMYVTYVRPILEYCAQVWHYNIPEYLSKDIERIQLKAMKIIDPSLSYNDALAVFDIPTLSSRREQLYAWRFLEKGFTTIQSPLWTYSDNKNSQLQPTRPW